MCGTQHDTLGYRRWSSGNHVYDEEAICVKDGEQCGAESPEVFGGAGIGRECLGLMGIEQEHECGCVSAHPLGVAVGVSRDAPVVFQRGHACRFPRCAQEGRGGRR